MMHKKLSTLSTQKPHEHTLSLGVVWIKNKPDSATAWLISSSKPRTTQWSVNVELMFQQLNTIFVLKVSYLQLQTTFTQCQLSKANAYCAEWTTMS